jgi:hypothetical protein
MTVADCILYGSGKQNGYSYVYAGIVNGRKTVRGAHVIALEKKLVRPLRPGYEACHTCDVRNCINEDHLFEGTRSDNILDAVHKGRWGYRHRSKTECKRGHPLSGANVYHHDGRRHCRECRKLRR